MLPSGKRLQLLPDRVRVWPKHVAQASVSSTAKSQSRSPMLKSQSVNTFIPVLVKELRLKPQEREENLQIRPPGG